MIIEGIVMFCTVLYLTVLHMYYMCHFVMKKYPAMGVVNTLHTDNKQRKKI